MIGASLVSLVVLAALLIGYFIGKMQGAITININKKAEDLPFDPETNKPVYNESMLQYLDPDIRNDIDKRNRGVE